MLMASGLNFWLRLLLCMRAEAAQLKAKNESTVFKSELCKRVLSISVVLVQTLLMTS